MLKKDHPWKTPKVASNYECMSLIEGSIYKESTIKEI